MEKFFKKQANKKEMEWTQTMEKSQRLDQSEKYYYKYFLGSTCEGMRTRILILDGNGNETRRFGFVGGDNEVQKSLEASGLRQVDTKGSPNLCLYNNKVEIGNGYYIFEDRDTESVFAAVKSAKNWTK